MSQHVNTVLMSSGIHENVASEKKEPEIDVCVRCVCVCVVKYAETEKRALGNLRLDIKQLLKRMLGRRVDDVQGKDS